MTEFTPSTTETREIRGRGVTDDLSSIWDGVGIGALRTRTDDQKAVYASRRGMKMSMANVDKSIINSRRRTRCPKRIEQSSRDWRTLREGMMEVVKKRRSGGRAAFLYSSAATGG